MPATNLTIDTIAYLRKLAGVSRLCVDISTTLHCQLQASNHCAQQPASAEAKTRWAALTGFDVS